MEVIKKRIFLAHNSCLNSSYDLNLLKAGLKKADYEIVEQPELADEIIFSGCSVREVWVDDAINQINELNLRAPNAKVTITGCIANVSADAVSRGSRVKELSFRTQPQILSDLTGFHFEKLDSETSQDNLQNYEGDKSNGLKQLRQRVGPIKADIVASFEEIDREFGTRLQHFYRRSTKGFVFYNETEKSELITVTRSCLYKCSFCNIPQGRGKFTSVPLKDILSKAQAAIMRGVKHFILIGDEIGNYGADLSDTRIADLLRQLIELDRGIRISIRYIEPKPLMRNIGLITDLCISGNIELLYISLQSGSQRVLNAMNRGYNIVKIAETYRTLRNSTDTIFYCNWLVGFPGETEEDFEQTLKLAQTLNLHINVVIPFSSRPGTPAANIELQISEEVKAERVARLTAIISDMKVSLFDQKLNFLSEDIRKPLLDKIRKAELEQYHDPKTSEKMISITPRVKKGTLNPELMRNIP